MCLTHNSALMYKFLKIFVIDQGDEQLVKSQLFA